MSCFVETTKRLILHLCEAVDEGYERVLVISRDTDVLLLLVHVMPTKPVEVWMISRTAKSRKCYPVLEASQRLTQCVKTILLSFHALTGCDTTSDFHGYGKKSCWKTFLNQPLLVAGICRNGELAPIEQFVCHLYGRPETKPGCKFLARPRRVWRCYPQLRMHWNFTQYTCQLPRKYLAASRPATHTGDVSSPVDTSA